MLEHRESALVAVDHPCLAGHFPGRPVVPAVVILERVAQALARGLGRSTSVSGISSAKFLSPLAPGESFSIELKIDTGTASAWFRCLAGSRELAQGKLEYCREP